MQDGDISPTEFYKVLQEVVIYRKLKADIRNQAKTKVKQITKEQQKGTRKDRRQRRFFTKNCKYFRYLGCQCLLKYETPPPYSMWFYGP